MEKDCMEQKKAKLQNTWNFVKTNTDFSMS